jgi:aminoglycoside 2'-N-acetyltransferase I
MVDVRVTHTAWLEAGELADIRALLDGAFRGRFSDDDFEHGLGGIHALVLDGEALVAHGSVVMRRLLHEGRALRTGYVEAVAVRADRRRLGHAGLVMEQLERVVRGGYDLGALSASSMARSFYRARGWQPWTGTASVLAPGGLQRLPGEEDSIHLLPVTVTPSPGGDLACDWRAGDAW